MKVNNVKVLILSGLFMVLGIGKAHSIDVSKWSVYEVSLTSGGTISNGYLGPKVTATFSGPGGIKSFTMPDSNDWVLYLILNKVN